MPGQRRTVTLLLGSNSHSVGSLSSTAIELQSYKVSWNEQVS